MSTDKTRDKLVASMRKTKQSIEEVGDQVDVAKTAAEKPVDTRAEKPKAATRTKTKSKKALVKSAKASPAGVDHYQKSHRVWPD